MSEGLWKGRTIKVKGFPWLNGEEREVGVGSFQSKILCKDHNSNLSELDTEAKKTFDTIEAIFIHLDKNKNLKPSKSFWRPKTNYIDGCKFERWTAKLLVGLFCAEGKDSQWHDTKTEPLKPPPFVVQSIYGHIQFEKPAGLYLAGGYQGEHFDGLRVEPVFYPDSNGLMGAHINFRGIQFFIWLSREPVESFIVPAPSGVVSNSSQAKLEYHMEMFRFPIRNVVNQKLVFKWE